MDQHLTLLVHGRGERLAGLHRNGRIARDDHVHQAAEGFEAKGKRGHIQQQEVFEPAGQDFRLNGRAQGHGFFRILRGVQGGAARRVMVASQPHVTTGFLEIHTAEPWPDQSAHQRHPGLSAHQDDLIQILGFELGVGQ